MMRLSFLSILALLAVPALADTSLLRPFTGLYEVNYNLCGRGDPDCMETRAVVMREANGVFTLALEDSEDDILTSVILSETRSPTLISEVTGSQGTVTWQQEQRDTAGKVTLRQSFRFFTDVSHLKLEERLELANGSGGFSTQTRTFAIQRAGD